ncbi:TPA: YnfC family lipoprotein [Serratia fonticola]|nr:YnfC family lipoprotein [Serratia fonticola]
MKPTLLLLMATIMLSGCDNKNADFAPQMKNYAYLYQFEAIPGKVKSTHQRLFSADDTPIFDVDIAFDGQGCISHVKSIDKAGEITEVTREGDKLTGTENGQDVVVTLNKQCALIKKVTPTMTVDIGYNDQGWVDQISSPASDVKFHLTYNNVGDMTLLSIKKGDEEVSRATAKHDTDANKISDVVTTVQRNEQSKTVTTQCQYKNDVPFHCDTVTTDGAGQVTDRQYGTIDVTYY